MPDDDSTPTPDRPTEPALSQGLRCPRCHGRRYELTIDVLDPLRADSSPCSLCDGDGTVTRHEFAEFHATSQGRPPAPPPPTSHPRKNR